MFMVNFSFSTQCNWLDDHQRQFRLRSGKGQVKISLRSGQKKSKFKLIFLHIKGVYSMQLITGNPMSIAQTRTTFSPLSQVAVNSISP